MATEQQDDLNNINTDKKRFKKMQNTTFYVQNIEPFVYFHDKGK